MIGELDIMTSAAVFRSGSPFRDDAPRHSPHFSRPSASTAHLARRPSLKNCHHRDHTRIGMLARSLPSSCGKFFNTMTAEGTCRLRLQRFAKDAIDAMRVNDLLVT